MASESPVALIYGFNGTSYIETSIRAGIAVPAGQPGFLAQGSDGTNTRTLLTTTLGQILCRPGDAISSGNSTTTNLGSGATFPGAWEDTLGYADIGIGVFANVASATDGLVIEYSADGVTAHDSDVFTVPANNGQQISFGAKFRYFRVRYTNGGTGTSTLVIQTRLSATSTRASTHRLADIPNDQQDAELVKAVLAGRTNAGNYANINATTGGSLKISIEEQITGTLNNGAETAVTNVAATILAANSSRKMAIIQNTGVANIRVGTTGVTATTGFRLVPGQIITFSEFGVPTNAIVAIREGAISSTALAQEVV